ncbi:MAG: hypothetical protein M0Q22_06295 [Sulfuritalea sp.]|jgi:hypothetical protein|nr:hypothetical protein [Sulfuritalea sp.]
MNHEIPSRRRVLRGAFAMGCGLCLPVILSGCDAKPGASSGSAVPPAGPTSAPSADAAAPAATKKVPQASVQYQAQPKGDQKCAACTNFIAGSNGCKLVDGQISAEGWCVLWAKRV